MARADWLYVELQAAGLDVVEDPGWATRGGSNLTILGVVVHHTASNPGSDPAGDLNYICRSGPLVPEYNLYVSRTGRITCCASGVCNHAGKGGPWRMTGGQIPLDSANSRTLAIVGANNGVGEPWPSAQQDSMVEACAVICRRTGLKSADVISHHEWCQPSCPGRKIDPAGQSHYATGSAIWDMHRFRADIVTVGTQPPPLEEDLDMPYLLITPVPIDQAVDAVACFSSGNVRRVAGLEYQNLRIRAVPTLEDRDRYQALAEASRLMYGPTA